MKELRKKFAPSKDKDTSLGYVVFGGKSVQMQTNLAITASRNPCGEIAYERPVAVFSKCSIWQYIKRSVRSRFAARHIRGETRFVRRADHTHPLPDIDGDVTPRKRPYSIGHDYLRS